MSGGNGGKDELDGPLRVEDVVAHASKPKILNVWDFIGDSDAESQTESIGCSSTRSPLDADATSTGLPSDFEINFPVAAEPFQEPCEPVSTSGGTAAFFHVRYRPGMEPLGCGPDHYVGKDLSHASDEIEFYDTMRLAIDQDGRFANFHEMCMDCPGVCRIICKGIKDQGMEVRNLLLLENLRTGYDKMRLIDVKMGAETSVACWKGKSRLHAWKNARVDQRTNSLVEGFRLEGIESPPRLIQDRIDLVNVGSQGRMRSKIISGKAAKRFLLQRLRAQEFLAAWCDVSSLGAGAELHAHSAVWSAVEQVGRLFRVCVDLPIPQQWIGSSIAMGLEVGRLCKHPKVTVKVFDWGRAELSTLEHHQALPPDQKKERIRFWRQYMRALTRFYWEVTRICVHRCCSPCWGAYVFELRIEPVSIVRAALTGKTISEVRGVGLFQLPAGGLKGGSASIVLPLVSAKNVPNPITNKSMIGALHIHISTETGRQGGEGATIVEVRGATSLPADMDAAGNAIAVVKVIGFELTADARAHCERCRAGQPEPCPRGRAYAQTTAPGKIIAGTMVWEASLEWFGHGEDAAGMQERFEGLMPESLRRALREKEPLGKVASIGSSSGRAGSSPRASPPEPPLWPDILPPNLGDDMDCNGISQEFGARLVPWLLDGSQLPRGWL